MFSFYFVLFLFAVVVVYVCLIFYISGLLLISLFLVHSEGLQCFVINIPFWSFYFHGKIKFTYLQDAC